MTRSKPEKDTPIEDVPKEPTAYARMPTSGFHRVARAMGILGNPHGLRVAMGKSLVHMADSGDWPEFFKQFGMTAISELPRGKSSEEKSAAIVNETTAPGMENFARNLSPDRQVELQALLDKINSEKKAAAKAAQKNS